jgi:hypothetical protein
LTPPTIHESTFYGRYGAKLIAASPEYRTADYWKLFNNITAPITYEAAGTTFEIDGLKYEIVSLNEQTCRLYSIDEAVVGEHVAIPESIEYMNQKFTPIEIKGTLVNGESSIKTLTIPSSVTTISEGMIFNASLEKLTIDASITSDLLGISSIDEFVITPSVTKFGIELPSNSIGTIIIEYSETPLTTSTFTCETTSLYLGRNVSANTFKGMTALKNVTFSDKLTNIANADFSDCSGLTSLSIPNSITTIGDDAFSGCTGITQLTFEDGDSILAIEADAFKSTSLTEVYFGRQMDFTKVPCENLETVELGENVTSMVNGAFTEGNAVRTVISHNQVPPASNDAEIFSTRTYLEGELYVPEASIQAYQATNGWKLFGVVKALPDDGDSESSIGIGSVDTDNSLIGISVKHGVVYVCGKTPDDEV